MSLLIAEKERRNEHKIQSGALEMPKKERLPISRLVERWNRHGPRRISKRAWDKRSKIEKQIADDSDETRRRLIIEKIGEMSFYVFENHRQFKICEFVTRKNH